ncbi:MAG TPA: vanadium-dependent haloperoxidase [Flavitalea sp.]|nr:vanadium-dependent haloperoxidase [Flavitalea sp.]
MTRFRYSVFISFLFCSSAVIHGQSREVEFAHRSINSLTEVMIRDITSPPVASRSYLYTTIAFYESVRPGNSSLKSLAGSLNGLDKLPAPSSDSSYDWLTCGLAAFYQTARWLVFSKELFQQSWDSIQRDADRRNLPADVVERSVRFGNAVALQVIAWAKTDNYAQTRGMQRFTESKADGEWKQTPPDYMEAVEPYWKMIRTTVLDKPDVFKVDRPPAYQSEEFMKECREVYQVGNKLTRSERNIANFWDCNPFATQTVGHLVYSIKKLSPAGHWIGITRIAIDKTKQDLAHALLSYSLVSVSMFDAIIAVWDEKYRSNYIRPVTAIQKFISPTWQPLLQTPPFPEYLSGHSVISMSAATMLTKIYGDKFSFADNSEQPYGLPIRKFKSFYIAANEAGMSRLYGGIHFRKAVIQGLDLGRKVGEAVTQRMGSRGVMGDKIKNAIR